MHRLTPSRSFCTLALALCAGLCHAQPAPTPQPALPHATPAATPPTPAPRPQLATPQDDRISLNFPGGTLADYIQVLNTAPGIKHLNIILNNGAEKAQVPPVALTGVSPMVALQVLEEIASISGGIVISSFGGEGSSGGETVWVVSARERPRRPEEFLKTSVFSLGIIADAPAQADETKAAQERQLTTLLSAVEAALSVSTGTPPQLKFHRESGLLIVRGTEDDEQVVRNVISELRKPERDRAQTQISEQLSSLALEQTKLERDDKALDDDLTETRKKVREISNLNPDQIDRDAYERLVARLQSMTRQQDALRERMMKLQLQRDELLKKSARVP